MGRHHEAWRKTGMDREKKLIFAGTACVLMCMLLMFLSAFTPDQWKAVAYVGFSLMLGAWFIKEFME